MRRPARSPQEWVVAPRLPNESLDRVPGLSRLIVQLLDNRGIRDQSDIHSFIAGDEAPTADPFLLKGMPEAVARIRQAILSRELVAIHGDFDADGLTATAVATEALRAVGADVRAFVPQREDGYGMAESGVRQIAALGARLIVTVDCGISSAREVDLARELGMDVVITDHHQLTGTLPNARAIVNPRQPDCGYPFKPLAGVGVAFKLAQALLRSAEVVDGRTPGEVECSLLDLVAIGTVVDVVPLLGENRVLTCRGIAQVARGTRPGLRELCRVAGYAPATIGSWEIGYALGPRLNAAGRLGSAQSSYQLLVADETEAPRLAESLDQANRTRQLRTEEMIDRARVALADQDPDHRVLLVAGKEYAQGILGLVAARLVEEYSRPAFVLGIDGEQARGSARSVAEFDLAAALGECSDLLARFGGHARAAGFAVSVENIEPLRERLLQVAGERMGDFTPRQRLAIDAELKLSAVGRQQYDDIQRLAPFGHENPDPLFLSRSVRVLEGRVVGQSAPGHLKLTLVDGSRRWSAIGFGLGAQLADLPAFVDVAYHLEMDNWNGRQSLRLRLKGIRPSQETG